MLRDGSSAARSAWWAPGPSPWGSVCWPCPGWSCGRPGWPWGPLAPPGHGGGACDGTVPVPPRARPRHAGRAAAGGGGRGGARALAEAIGGRDQLCSPGRGVLHGARGLRHVLGPHAGAQRRGGRDPEQPAPRVARGRRGVRRPPGPGDGRGGRKAVGPPGAPRVGPRPRVRAVRVWLRRTWARWRPVGLAQDVRWTRQAVDERVVMRLLKDVQSARLTTPRWRWYRRWHQRRLIALLQLAFVA